MKKLPEIFSNPTLDGVRDEGHLVLGEYPVPRTTVDNCLKIIFINPITNYNAFPLRYREFLS